MADPWQPLDGDDGAAAAGPRRLEHFSPPSTPAGPVAGGTPGPTPGLAGHRALAALAAELAQAAAGEESGAQADDASEPDQDGSPESPQPVSPPDPAAFPKPRLLSRLPLPGSPGGTRLPETRGNGADHPAMTNGGRPSTVTLRRRPVPDLPAPVDPAPVSTDPEPAATAAAPVPAAASNIIAIEAWSARDDDILPRRQVRRARPKWRRR